MLDLLAFAPHPDDAELACGGTLLRLSSMGYRVGVVDLTEGELGTRGTARRRSMERAKASRALGLAVREGLGLPDMGLSGVDRAQLEAVVGAVRAHRPAVVLAPHWEDRHPDHVEGSALVTHAFFLAGAAKFTSGSKPFKPSALAYYLGSLDFEPSFVVDVSDQFEGKMKAIGCYSSQFSPRLPGEPETDIAHPHFLERIRARARHYGLMAGVEYGEPYLVKRPIALGDPIAVLAGLEPKGSVRSGGKRRGGKRGGGRSK
jgi:bacillithiol biosynthesis deacetylase BshB1